MPLTNKDKDKIEIAVMSLAAAAIVIYGKMKQRSETKDYDYKKVEIEIPYGCKNLKDFVKLETEFSETVNSVFWSLRNMNHSSITSSDDEDEYVYDEDDKEENKTVVKDVEEKVNRVKSMLKDEVTKRIPSSGEVRGFLLHATKTVKLLKNLEKSVKELEDEVKDTSYYNNEYKKVAKLALTVCRKYLQVYSKMISIMDKYLKNRDNDSKNESIEFLYEELLQEFSIFNKKKNPSQSNR